MKNKASNILLIFFSVFFLMGGSEALCKTSEDPALLLKEADQCREELYSSTDTKKYSHNWLRCIHHYESLYARYPTSDQVPWAIYHSAQLYTGLYTCSRRPEHLDEAISLYRRLVNEYEDHPLADDAQYMIGEIYFEHKKDAFQAREEFAKVGTAFPSGEMWPRARERLDELADILRIKYEEERFEITPEAKSGLIGVKNIRHWSFPKYTRVVIDLEGPVEYEHHLLKAEPDNKKPQRLYLDLEKVYVTPQITEPIDIRDGLIHRARAGQFTSDTVRVVLDMDRLGEYRIFELYDPFQIVVEVERPEAVNADDGSKLDLERMVMEERDEKTKVTEKKQAPVGQPEMNGKGFVISVPAPSFYELSGHLAAEGRVFFNDALFPGQRRNNASVSVEPDFFCEWENGSSFTFVPFARLDSADSERSHFDVRELNYLWLADSWELRVGIGKVFWGVTEFVHLVDIVNQTDAVESIDGEDKLGQPMVHLSIPRDWGTVDMFVLPYFRERTFPGQKGRLRSGLRIDADRARFESGSEKDHIDFALRYSRTIGDWDVGTYYFKGTGREPTLLLDPQNQVFIPYYEQINQSGLDLQLVEGEWLFKLEAIYRTGQMDRMGQEDDFFACIAGFEYTWVRIVETYMDLGIIGEFAYDDRGDGATVPYENDVMLGLRLSVNDAASSSLLAGVSQDTENSSRAVSIEASRRFGNNWKGTLEAGAFFEVPEDDILYSLRDDDFVRIEMAYYF